jgi:Alw26I/Eco31I/Esp3I family type II restriction m6 adenine DNA methyltransferase
MEHTHILHNNGPIRVINSKDVMSRATGRFYTPNAICKVLAKKVISGFTKYKQKVRIVDPFCGDGRLLEELIDQIILTSQENSRPSIEVCGWDIDKDAVKIANQRFEALLSKICKHMKIVFSFNHIDTFLQKSISSEKFDFVITNPPWETLKPDTRELNHLSIDEREIYKNKLREYDSHLAAVLPKSQPSKKFSGWGTNLSRCGLELSLSILAPEGVCGIVLPAAILGDQMSVNLRQWLVDDFVINSIDIYPAEAKLFPTVDQSVCSLVINKTAPFFDIQNISIEIWDRQMQSSSSHKISLNRSALQSQGYSIPVEILRDSLDLERSLINNKKLEDFEGKDSTSLWLGRELDETGYLGFTSQSGDMRFIKGRMIQRYQLLDNDMIFVDTQKKKVPESTKFERLVWRDVSRRSQQRRMYASIIPSGTVTGNSLHVAYFRNADSKKLRILLVIFNSLVFEYQIRSKLSTGHISLGVVRTTRVPSLSCPLLERVVSEFPLSNICPETEAMFEIAVAKSYGIDHITFSKLVGFFEGITELQKSVLLSQELWNSI